MLLRLFLIILLFACSPALAAEELTVSAAISLKESLLEIGQIFFGHCIAIQLLM